MMSPESPGMQETTSAELEERSQGVTRIQESRICQSCLRYDEEFLYDCDLDMLVCAFCFFEIYLADYVPIPARAHSVEFHEKVNGIRASPSYESKFSWVTWIEVD